MGLGINARHKFFVDNNKSKWCLAPKNKNALPYFATESRTGLAVLTMAFFSELTFSVFANDFFGFTA
jgi:hypothetical protein